MAEQIGKVILDDTFYPGEDLYCDGDIEDTLLSIVKEYPQPEYQRIIEESRSWPVLYHLSHFRENIVSWLPVDKTMKVLEIGAGCGAVTGALAARAGSVTCIDLSKKRSMINAYRHQDCDNITIKIGNFKDIEPTLDTDYDYVFLIGVFEYAQGYMGSDAPYHDFMKIIKKHCAEAGRIVIAIENRYGLKYFAGCREDHVGEYFTGIEDYPSGGGVRTFSRNGLIRIMQDCGIDNYHFYYPYPDYKFMTAVYSDEYLPRVGELTNNLRNFDRERMLLFDEKNVYDGLIRDGMFQEFANSFLVVIGNRPEQIYAKFSNDRKPEYAICTLICSEDARNAVEKRPDLPQAAGHIRSLREKYELLKKKYEGCPLEINRCEERADCVCFEFLHGKTLEETLDECLYGNDRAGFEALLKRYQMLADYHQDMEVCDYDLIFSNIMINDVTDTWTLIDYEWTLQRAMSGADTAKRALFVYMTGPEIRRRWLFDQGIAQNYGIYPEELERLQKEECAFQREVTGIRASMYELYDQMGQPVLEPEQFVKKQQPEELTRRFQLYEDQGEGFSEEHSRFYPRAYVQEHQIKLRILFSGADKRLRLDPAMEPCMLYHMEMTVNGSPLPDGAVENNGFAAPGGALVFATQDPNLTVDLSGTGLNERNELMFTADVQWLCMEAAASLCGAQQEPPKQPEEKAGRKLLFRRKND